MDDRGGLRWKGPMQVKARQIPDDLWTRYEPEIREMHSTMTVDQLAAYMNRVHGFKATPRQYSTKFVQWDLKKYNTRRVVSAPPTMQSAEATDINCQAEDSRAAEVVESTQRLNKDDAPDYTSDVPDTKRRKADDTASFESSPLRAYVESLEGNSSERTLTLSLEFNDPSFEIFKEASHAMRCQAPP